MYKQMLKIMLLLAMVSGAYRVPYAGAATVTLPKTGQTVCYDAAYQPTACSNTAGQDANKLKGADWPVPRFIENMKSDGITSNGTVTDDLTGLIWLKDAGCFSTVGGIAKGTDPATSYLTWPDALTWSNNLKGDANGSLCSLKDSSVAGDWRLPSRKELQSLIDRQNGYYAEIPGSSALPTGHPFINVQYNWYWSSSTYVDSTVYAWIVYMSVGVVDYDGKGGSSYVWPVRAGQFGDSVSSALPASKDFGTVNVSNSPNQTITISNSGATSRLHINAMVLSGTNADQFSLNVGDGSGGTCGSKTPIIAPGGNCTVSVIFTPGSVGAKAASLRISGSDVNTPNIDIALSGTGEAAPTTYTIGTSVTGGNGEITCDTPITSGDTCNCTISNITAGYHLHTFTDNTVDKLSSVAANAYSITNVTADHTIAGTFALNSHTVTYSSNGGSGAMTDSSSPYVYGSQVTVKANTFTKTGYAFVKWNTQAGGGGTDYAGADTFSITADTTLYAQWTPTYTVTYNSNGGSGTMTDASSPYLTGATVTVKTNTFTRTGYTFAGWYQNSAGTGTAYGTTFTMASANVTLYAKWTALPTYTVTYNSNGGTGTMTDAGSPYLTGATVTVKNNTFTRTGYSFVAWYQNSACTGTAYGTTFTMASANVTLYAKWTPLPTYTVTYNSNGGSGTMTDANSPYLTGATVTVKTNSFTRTGYTFAGWNTEANGSGTDYTAAGTFSMGSANVTLYAKWTTLPTYTVTYNANGGTGTMTDAGSPYLAGATITVKTNTFIKKGYSFAGWYPAADGTGTAYGTSFTMNSADTILYAKWAEPTLADALKALRAYYEIVVLTDEEKIRYDVAPLLYGLPQGDSLIDIGDVALLLRRSIGIGSW